MKRLTKFEQTINSLELSLEQILKLGFEHKGKIYGGCEVYETIVENQRYYIIWSPEEERAKLVYKENDGFDRFIKQKKISEYDVTEGDINC